MASRRPTRTRKSGNEAKTLDINALEKSYIDLAPRLQALVSEASYILEDAISDNEIKIHGIESRIKTLNSIIQKSNEKSIENPLADLNDIVGTRVICLFKSDLPKIEEIIRNNFSIVSVDDKTLSEDDSIGYLSIHYICRMKDEYKGPRYKKIKEMRFEIQLRTICMHAWAAVSHYLDYKGEWDVPFELRKSLNALSGLFYVADSEFQKISELRNNARIEISTDVSSETASSSEINFDTVYAVIDSRYKRKVGSSDSISHLVQQLQELNIKTIGEWVSILDEGDKAMFAEDAKRDDPYIGVGCARVSTAKASPAFDAIRRRSIPQ